MKDRIFAAALLDGEITGTPLEGLNFNLVASELLEFLPHYEGKPTLKETLTQHLQHFKNLSESLNEGHDISLEILKKLKDQNDVLFPGGWCGYPYGHAIVYRLFNHSKDGLIFLAYNTGAGIGHHKRIPSNKSNLNTEEYRQRYNPVYAIKFSDKDKLQRFGGITAWLKILLKPLNATGYDNNSAETIYHTLFSKSAYLGGKVVEPEPYYKYASSGQRSGACARKSVEKALKSFFDSKEAFSDFLLQNRVYLLTKQKDAVSPDLYAKALENTLRMLQDSKALIKYLSLEKHAAYIKILEALRPEKPEASTLAYKTPAVIEDEIINPPVIQDKIVPEKAAELPKIPENLPKIFLNQTALLLPEKAPDDLVAAVKELSALSNDPDSRAFVSALEALCTTFCAQISNEKNQAFVNDTASLEDWALVAELLCKYSMDYSVAHYSGDGTQYLDYSIFTADKDFLSPFSRVLMEKGILPELLDIAKKDQELQIELKKLKPVNLNDVFVSLEKCTNSIMGTASSLFTGKNTTTLERVQMLKLIVKMISKQFTKSNKNVASSRNQIVFLALTALSHYVTLRYDAKLKGQKAFSQELSDLDYYWGELPRALLFENKFHQDFLTSNIDPKMHQLLHDLRNYYGKSETTTERFSTNNANNKKMISAFINYHSKLFQDLRNMPAFQASLFEVERCYYENKQEILNNRDSNQLTLDYIEQQGLIPLFVFSEYGLKEKNSKDNHFRQIYACHGFSELTIAYNLYNIKYGADHGSIYPRIACSMHPYLSVYLDKYGYKYIGSNIISSDMLKIFTNTSADSSWKNHQMSDWCYLQSYNEHLSIGIDPKVMYLLADIFSKVSDSNADKFQSYYNSQEQELLLLCKSQNLQLIQVLDYYRQNFTLLQNFNHQFFAIHMAFAIGAIDSALEQNADIFAASAELYRLTVLAQEFIQEPLSTRALFVLKFNTYLYGYILQSKHATKAHKAKASAALLKIHESTKDCLINAKETAVQAVLQRLNFYQLMHLHTQQDFIDKPILLQKTLETYFFACKYQAIRAHHFGTLVEDDAIKSIAMRLEVLPKDTLIQAVKGTLAVLYPSQAPFTHDKTSNALVFIDNVSQKIVCDLHTGIANHLDRPVKKPCREIPKQLSENAFFQTFLGKNQIKLIAKTGDTLYFTCKDIEHKLIENSLWRKLGEKWYRYVTFTPGLPKAFQVETAALLADDDHRMVIAIADSAEILYEYLANKGWYAPQLSGYLCSQGQNYRAILTALQKLDIAENITIVIDENDAKLYKIYLKNYDLSGSYHASPGILNLQYANKEYTVIEDDCLLTTLRHNEESLHIIPIRPFYNTEASDGSHYRLAMDMKNQSKTEIKYGQNAIAVYQKNKSGHYEALTNRADNLYLAYLYCIDANYDAAEALLRKHPFRGTVEELTFLYWIAEKTPALLSSQKDHYDLLDNPLMSAIRLQAMVQIARTRADTTSSTNCNKEVQAFLECFVDNSIKYYTQYQRMHNNLSLEQQVASIDINYLAEELRLSLEQAQRLEPDLQKRKEIELTKLSNPFTLQYSHTFIDFPTTYGKMNFTPFWPYKSSIYTSSLEKLTHALSAQHYTLDILRLDITEDQLITHLPTLFAVILDKNAIDAQKTLEEWCIATLQSYATLRDEDPNNTVIIATVLLHAIDNRTPLLEIYQTLKSQDEARQSKERENYTPSALWRIIDDPSNGFYTKAPTKVRTLDHHGAIQQLDEHAVTKAKAKLPETTPPKPPQNTLVATFDLPNTEELRATHKDFMETRKAIINAYKNKEKHTQKEQFDAVDKALDDLTAGYQEKVLQALEKSAIDPAVIESHLLNLENNLKDQQKQFKAYAEILPQGLKELITAQTKKLGKKILETSLDELILQYAYNIDGHYLKEHQVTSESAAKIQALTETFLQTVFLYRQYQAIQKSLAGNDKLALTEQIINLQTLNKAPAYNAFQYADHKILREEQWDFIERFVQSTHLAGQLMMGYGKTKVILPILAFLKANGENLVIIEAPPELLLTIFNDLQSTLKRNFNRELILFSFDRHEPSDITSLSRHLLSFKDAIERRAFVMAAPSSIQSLQLKYRELLDNAKRYKKGSEKYHTAVAEIKVLKEILELLKSKGIIIADELHQVLDIDLELSYAIGSSKSPDIYLSDEILKLYCFLKTKAIEVPKTSPLYKLNGKSLMDFLHNPEILYHPNDLLPELMKYYETLYFENISSENAAILAEMFNIYLPTTLHSKLDEHYGSIKNHEIAVPYAGNNTPTRNFFANVIETINYTTQMTYLQGVSYQVFEQLISGWHKYAQSQMFEKTDDLCEYNQKYQTCLSGNKDLPANILDVKITNSEHLLKIYQAFQHNDAFIHYALTEKILPSIQIFAEKLTSNPIKHVQQVRAVQGFTGTLSTAPSFDQSILVDVTTLFGVKNNLKTLLLEKETKIITTNEVNLADYQVFLDRGAHNRGKRNIEFARLRAQAFKEKANNPIKYVLFFDDNQLSALDVNNENHIIQLPSTEPESIKACLKVDPHERATDYDQNHTTGIDILQDTAAEGLITVDLDTTLSEFLQTIKRLRALSSTQKITIVVSPELQAKLGDHRTLEALYQILEDNEAKKIAKAVFKYANKAMLYLAEQDLEQRLFSASIEESINLFEHYKPILVDKNLLNLKTDYQEEQTTIVLERIKNQTIDAWKAMVGSDPTALKKLENACDKIIEHAKIYCTPTQITNAELKTQVNIMQEQEVELTLKTEVKNQVIDPNLKPELITLDWAKSFTTEALQTGATPLSQLWSSTYPDKVAEWTNNILLSENFYTIHATQGQNNLNASMPSKPNLATLFWKNAELKLQCILVCQEEAGLIADRIVQKTIGEAPEIWLESTTGFVLSGSKPTQLDADYTALKEQAYTLLGSANLLAQRKEFVWFKKEHLLILKQAVVDNGNGDLTPVVQIAKQMNALSDLKIVEDPAAPENTDIGNETDIDATVEELSKEYQALHALFLEHITLYIRKLENDLIRYQQEEPPEAYVIDHLAWEKLQVIKASKRLLEQGDNPHQQMRTCLKYLQSNRKTLALHRDSWLIAALKTISTLGLIHLYRYLMGENTTAGAKMVNFFQNKYDEAIPSSDNTNGPSHY